MTSDSIWLLVMAFNILNETPGQTLPLGFRYASYEVTVPRKLTPRSGQPDHQDVTYLLQIEGKDQILHLRQKRGFVPKHFPIFTYGKEDNLQVDYPFIKDNCFYQGFVQGKSSLIAISTCSGKLRGLLQVENKTYAIEPVQTSPSFQHVVYRLEEEEGAIHMRCGLTEEEQSRQKAMIQNTEHIDTKIAPGKHWWTHKRYAKLVVVVEYERYKQFGKNETLTAMEILNIVNMADSLYEPLGVHVTLVGLEIWSQKNLIPISNNIDSLLQTFNLWRKYALAKRLEHVVAHLFVYKYFGSTLGVAYIGTACEPEWASGVESFTTSILSLMANTLAHELGHNLGMSHDSKYCTCDQRYCIMAPTQKHTDKFSNCSYDSYFNLRNTGALDCLLISAEPDKVYTLKYCGNRVVEEGEQCDCGSKTNCEGDPCCQSNCMLRSGASCAFGKCCANCRFLPTGTICRENTSICDLPEYCSGTSERCPENVYVQNGAPCKNGAYCYNGNCFTHSEQCKTIFGKEAKVAPESCFRELNVRGDRFGNCGINGDKYDKCKANNTLCGRIQCENIDKLPSLEEHSTVIQTPSGKRFCWSTDYHFGMDTVDIGSVRDGTPCGPKMICIGRECAQVSLLNYDCNVTKCHNRGICNTYKHCHCDYGWAPPDCLSKGTGGSLDSGTPPQRIIPPPQHSSNAGAIVVGIVLAPSVVFCSGLVIYFRSAIMQQCGRLIGRFSSS